MGAVLVLSCGKDSPIGPRDRAVPAQLAIVSGENQVGTVGVELPDPILVKVLDSQQQPIPGQLVNFRVTSGGGSVFAGSAVTNSSGIAGERWTLGTSTALVQTVEARAVSADGVKLVFATFHATSRADAPTAVSVYRGDAQRGEVGATLPDSLAAKVADKYGNGVPGVTVSWVVTTAGGAVSPVTSTSNAAGVAATAWTLGPTAGANGARASIPAVTPVQFSATGIAGGAARIDIVSGDAQSGTVGSALPQQLVVRVTDSHGNLVSDAPITWTILVGGGSLANTSAATGVDGLASATLTLGNVAGLNRVRAVSRTVGPVTFDAAGQPGPATDLLLTSGDNQTGAVGSVLSDALVARAVDRYGNGVPNLGVAWAVQTGGGSITADGPSNGDGYASAHWRLGTFGGGNAATASAAGKTVTFHATGTVSGAPGFTKISGDNQTTRVAVVLTDRLVVQFTDGNGQPVPGVAVTWTVTENNGVFMAAPDPSRSTSVTDTAGRSSVQFKVGTRMGRNTVEASAPGAPALTFTSIGTAAEPCLVTLQQPAASAPAGATIAIESRASDIFGNPTAGAYVQVSTSPSGGTTIGPELTDSGGVGRGTWQLAPVIGTQRIQWYGQQCNYSSYPNGFRTQSKNGEYVVTATPPHIAKVSGDGQTGIIGTALSAPLVVRVTGDDGAPVRGIPVTWSTGDGGTLTPTTSVTATDGTASSGLTLGPGPGTNNVWARVASDSAQFTATAVVSGATLTKTGGDGQSGTVFATLSDPLVVRLASASGAAIPNAVITWEITRGGGSVSPTSATTDAGGFASVRWTLGAAAGPNEVVARTSGANDVTFTALASNPALLTTISGGAYTTCGLDASGEAICWGENAQGQLGNRRWDSTPHPVPEAAAGGRSFSNIVTGRTQCGISQGDPYCWGSNFLFQLGYETTETCEEGQSCATTPTRVNGGLQFSTIAPGQTHTCALTSAGEAYCWGDNREGALGIGNSGDVLATPMLVSTGQRFSTISVGHESTCAIALNGAAFCWGQAWLGKLGTGTTPNSYAGCGHAMRGLDGEGCSTVPVPVAGGHTFTSIVVGPFSVCAIGIDQTYCWGDNSLGEIGDGSTVERHAPVAVASNGVTFAQIALNESHVCALATDGTPYCWGGNGNGELGIGSTDVNAHPTPQAVSGGGYYSSIVTGYNFTCALTAGGVPYCWGGNSRGQLGDGTTTDRTVPVRVRGY